MKTLLIIPALLLSLNLSANTSASNREDKSFLVAYTYGHDYNRTSNHAELSYFLSSRTTLGLVVAQTTGQSSGDKEFRSIATKLRRFSEGRTFNFSLDLFFRDFDHQNASDSRNSKGERGSKHFSDLGVATAIGNHWQWENIMFGIDWIGMWVRAHKFSGRYPETHIFEEKIGFSLFTISIGLAF